MSNKPKHTIRDNEAFRKGREGLGGLILEGMKITGGTDIDYLIERKGAFIILEFKEFHDDSILIPQGQMIAFENLYNKLASDNGKCHFLIFGSDDIDFKDPESSIWFFNMNDWRARKVRALPVSPSSMPNRTLFLVERNQMKEISLKGFRVLMETFWKDFEKK